MTTQVDEIAPESAVPCATSVQQRVQWLAGEARTVVVAELRGPVDAAVLCSRLRSYVARHEILRTAFPVRPGLRFPDQVVYLSDEVEWRSLPQCRSTSEALEEVSAEEQLALPRPETGPTGATVLRATLAPVAPGDRALLVLSAPALCCDATSLIALLGAALSPTPADESGEPLQYGDFAEWQASWTCEPSGAPTSQPTPTPPVPAELPLYGPDSSFDGPRTGVCTVTLGPKTASRLTATAERCRAGLDSYVLTGWAALLHRLTGAPETSVDLLADGRDVEELQGAVGAFEVPLTLSAQVSHGMTFGSLLAQLHVSARETRWTQDLRVAELGGQLERGRLPVATTAFRYLPAKQQAGLPEHCRLLRAYSEGPAHQLTVNCVESPEGSLTITLHHDRRQFADDAVAALAAQLRCLLEDAAARPDIALTDLEILDADGRARALELAGRHHRALEVSDESWHRVFEERARRHPDRIAVEYAEHRLTFAELEERAQALACRLAPFVARPGVPVGLLCGRSAEMIIGLLGILKAGGAYTPLDIDLPPDRAAALLRESGAVALVTQSTLTDRLPEDLELPVLRIEDTAAPAPSGIGTPPVEADSGDLAYVIHTSGTTGRPKGVAVAHRSVMALRAALNETVYAELGAEGPLRIGVNGPLAFDTSVKQIIQLLDGHTLVPIPAELRLEPDALLDHLERHRIEVVDCTPSQLSLWLEAGLLEREGLALRALLLGGEPVPPTMWRRLAGCPTLAAFNLYGPTEATVDTTWCRITGDAPHLGIPLPHTRVYVMDSGGRLVPPGARGELCVSGPGLATGYLGDPEATAQKFSANPYAIAGHELLYHTGDMGRHLRDGSLEYRGRIDRQAKIRGCRVEPGEIEEALAAHPAVREAAVAIRRDQPGEHRLAAYWVAVGADASPDEDELHAHLAARLPDYMVPSWILPLDSLPLNRNGKVDLAALPDPRTAVLQGDKEPPHTTTERTLASVWQEVTGAKDVGRDDNFFALGGDSIMSVQAATLARRLGLMLSPLQIVQHPTPAALAEALDGAADTAVTAEQGRIAGEVTLTPAQRRFAERRLAEPHHWNQAVLLSLSRSLPAGTLRAALHALVAHHDALRLRLRPAVAADGEPLRQEIAVDESHDLLTVADLSHLSNQQLEEEAERRSEEIQRSLDLERGPLLRGLYLRCGAGQPDRLLVVAHHLAVDGVSWRILLEDLEQTVRHLEAERPVVLPAKTTSYQEWSKRLWAHAESAAVRDQLPYWTEQLSELSRPILPRDFPDGSRSVRDAREALFTLGTQDTGTLLHAAAEVFDATFHEVLLAAVWGAIREWTGAPDLLLDLESHGREESVGVDLTRTVGWFTSVYPLLLSSGGQRLHFASLVAAVKSRTRAVPERGIGYGLLRYADDPQLTAPASEVLFNYLGRMERSIRATETTGAGEASEPLFTRAEGTTGAERSPVAERSHLLEVDTSVVDGELRLYLTYSPAVHRQRTVEALAERMLSVLRSAAAQARIHHTSTPPA